MIKALKEKLKNIDTSQSRLRKFGLVVGGILLAIFVYYDLFHNTQIMWVSLVGSLLILFGVIVPRWLYWLYYVWMGIAFVLGAVVSRVLLTIIFYLIITPIGVVVRLIQGNPLKFDIDKEGGSYWREYKINESSHFERPF